MIRWSERDEDRMVAQWEMEEELTWEASNEVPETFVRTVTPIGFELTSEVR